MGKKKNYETPFIERVQVETESSFCAASVIDDVKSKGIKSTGHEVGVDINVSDGLNGDDWSEDGWK